MSLVAVGQRFTAQCAGTRFYRRGRCLHRPEPAAGGSIRRKRPGREGLFASGGGLFTAEKFPKRAGGCGPRSPIRPRGVHPKERHFLGRQAPPGRPVPYCPPLPGFARASRIGQPLRLQNFPLRPHPLPRNVGWMLHTAPLRNLFLFAVGARIARQDTYDMRAPPSNVPGRDSTVGADACIGPNPPQAGPFDESAQAARARLPPAGDFSPRKSPQNAPGAAAPGPPFRPRGVHPKERHHPGRCAPPGRPVPYCPPLPGFARASKIAEPLRLRGDSLRPHRLPRNGGGLQHTAAFEASQPLSHGFAVTAPLAQAMSST